MKISKLFGFIALIAAVLTFSTCDIEEPHEHKWSEWSVSQRATCSKPGRQSRNCMGVIKSPNGTTHCNAWEYQDIPPDPSLHEFRYPKNEDIILEPTCTEWGSGTSYCSNGCGTSKIVDINPRHDYYSVTITAPTCILVGREEVTCLKCGHHETRNIAALGHKWVNSNTGNWLTGYKCSRCGIYKPG